MERLVHGKYQLLSKIQSGGFGTTWLAMDTTLNMQVAVKEYENADEKRKQQFLEEARSLAKFSGEPGIVNIRDFLEEDEKVYLIMEYLDGKDLKTYIEDKGKVSFAQTYQLLRPVMLTLDKLHQNGMIHRDVSPENIRMLSNGQVKLLDFGSSLEIECGYDNEKTMTVMVKPGYAPQEQYMNKAMQGAWTDVYAICATMYKCITGKTPMDSLQRSFYDELEKPSELGSDILPEQEKVLFRGMALKKEERISSMLELIKELDCAQGINVNENRMGEIELEKGGEAAVTWDKERKQTQVKSAKREKRKNAIGKEKISAVILGLLGIIAAVIIGITVYTNDPYRESTSSMAMIEESDVSKSMLNKIARDRKAEKLWFSDCTIDDNEIEAITKMKNITSITLKDCTGFTSLEPLAEMINLKELDVEGDYTNHSKGLRGEELFTVDFPHVVSLSVDNIVFEDQGECLRHFKNLEELSFANNEGFSTRKFLEDMSELRRLYIYSEDASDISNSLAKCTKLQYGSFNGSGVDDLSWVSGCKELEELYVNQCNITDISPLAACSELSHLEAGDNQIKDISSLHNCNELRWVSLENNQISDISFLQKCSELTYLTLSNNQIESLEGLEGKEQLRELEIDHNKVRDLAPLEKSTDLITMNASHNLITDTMPLSGCTKLSFLWLDDNQLTDLSGCEMMIKLNTFSAAENQLTDVKGLTNASSIKLLNLENNKITGDLLWMQNFTELETLNISKNEISSLQGIENNTNMKILIADQNQITDSRALENVTALKAVCLSNNQIENFDGMGNKTDLVALLASNNKIKDISVLETSIEQLIYLDLGFNDIKDIQVLSDLSGEKLLLLENNQISDISVLPGDVRYNGLSLYGNPIKDFSMLSTIEEASSAAIYLSYTEGLKAECFSEFNTSDVHIVDVPADQQAGLLKDIKNARNGWGSGDPVFQTKEQADEEIMTFREKLYNTALGRESEEDVDTEAVEEGM